MSHSPMGSSLRTAAGKRAAGLVPVRLSAAILNEYDTRCPECVPERLLDAAPGTYWLDPSDARALYADAVFNADAKGGREAAARTAYRALVAQIAKLPITL